MQPKREEAFGTLQLGWLWFQDRAQERKKNADRLESAFLRVMESLGRDRLHQKTDISR